MTNLIKRAVTGAIYVALIVCSLLFGGVWAFPLLCCIFSAGALYEFYHIGKPYGESPVILSLDLAIGIITTAIPLVLQVVHDGLAISLVFVCMALIARCVAQLYSSESNALDRLAFSFAGIIYISVPMALMSALMLWSTPYIALALFIMLWLNDTGAYIVGSSIGKHRLMERISPKKSWEGFFGGLFFTAVGAAVMAPWLTVEGWSAYGIVMTAVIGVIISVTATWGDLVESMIKRSRGVKDAGHILPGHGGILDRIDSLLLAVPMMVALWIISQTF